MLIILSTKHANFGAFWGMRCSTSLILLFEDFPSYKIRSLILFYFIDQTHLLIDVAVDQ